MPAQPGAVVRAFNAGPVERMPGVVAVVRQGSYLAVAAEREWQAVQAWRTLSAAAQWDDTATSPDQNGIAATIRGLPGRGIEMLHWTGAAGTPVRRLRASYTKPYGIGRLHRPVLRARCGRPPG